MNGIRKIMLKIEFELFGILLLFCILWFKMQDIMAKLKLSTLILWETVSGFVALLFMLDCIILKNIFHYFLLENYIFPPHWDQT